MAEPSKRKRLRLPEYDYSQNGAYFVTICTVDRRHIFWRPVGADSIRPGRLPLSELGWMAEESIRAIPSHYPQVILEKWVVMPNHIHLLLRIENGRRIISAPTKSLSTMIGQMKREVSKAAGYPVWQKGFYEHVVRNDRDFLDIWTYIDTNPAKWAEDCYYTEDTP